MESRISNGDLLQLTHQISIRLLLKNALRMNEDAAKVQVYSLLHGERLLSSLQKNAQCILDYILNRHDPSENWPYD